MLGLYSNCRKKPYKTAHAPLIGGAYGVFRSTQSNTYGSWCGITFAATDPTEIAAGTAFAQSTYNGVVQSCWDSNNDLGSSGWATDTYSNAIVGGVLRASGIRHGMQDEWYGSAFPVANSVPNGGSFTRDGIAAGQASVPTTFYLYGITVLDGAFFSSLTYSIAYDGTVIASGTMTASSFFNGGSPGKVLNVSKSVTAFDIGKLSITITNTSGSTRNLTLYVMASSFSPCGAARPCVMWSGVHTGGHDSPGITAGDLFRALTAETGGTGQAYVTCSQPYNTNIDGYTTAVSTGVHHCDLDELCNTWID